MARIEKLKKTLLDAEIGKHLAAAQIVGDGGAGADTVLWELTQPGFGVRIKPSGVTTFVFQYRFDGNSRRARIGRYGAPWTIDQARVRAKELRREVDSGHDPVAATKERRLAPTVAVMCGRFMAEHAEPYKKASSATEDRRNIDKHILRALGRKKVVAVTDADISRLHRSMRPHPYAANRVLSLLNTMFAMAERKTWGFRPRGSNPCREVTRYKETSRTRFLSGQELARLADALNEAERKQTAPASAIDAIRLLIVTGARKGEVVNLKWRNVKIDAANGTGELELEDSKTGKKTIYLNAPARELLAQRERGEDDAHVFPGRKPGSPLGGLQHTWLGIRDQAELPGVRLHDLRHTFASFAVSAGMGLPITGAMLGHREAATTERYAHLEADPVRAANERLGAIMTGAMERKSADVVEMGAVRPATKRQSNPA